MTRQTITAEQIDAILPQTQCGLCGFGGCMPYAEALVQENAAINLCPPGGVKGLRTIAQLVAEDPSPFIADMEKNTKPKQLALIREEECIGCTKCIQACPVDAIVGAAKSMHTIITAECTGCELCIPPCPVDCISIFAIAEETPEQEKQKANLSRERFRARNIRLSKENSNQTIHSREKNNSSSESLTDKKAFIQEAILRAQLKKKSS